ncbi:YbjN domain-containing protein [Corynebacterium breve]|uniref:YbjN domain-containing protein n=1 Tax=Corynebacterium breve TaxID=3049799 RepID=A0ABY8VGZ0_9CORY|nr:YbjN domain-containing protein [Corynebacterium breve]WIM68919.1 YbjN domain-containing protein [Corynebacterium breve]
MDENNIPEAFNIERVGDILAEENLQYRLEEVPTPDGTTQVIRTGFADSAIAFVHEGNNLVCEALWRGEFPKALATNLLFACNEYNQQQFAPTLRFYESGEHHVAANAFRVLDVSQGASLNQVGAFVLSTLDATVGAFDFLSEQFPDLVTWEENHDH